MIWKQAKQSNTISIGGETIEVHPLSLESCLRLVLMLAPHIATVEKRWPEIKEALATTDGARPQLLETVFTRLYTELAFAPHDVVTALALLLDRDFEWVALNTKPVDIVNAWPVLDKVNQFGELFRTIKALGILKVDYAN